MAAISKMNDHSSSFTYHTNYVPGFNTSSQLFLYRVNFLIKFRGYYKLMTKTQKLEIGLTNIINSMKAKNI
jgi:hypothetical protein